jgi:hypothetical protein
MSNLAVPRSLSDWIQVSGLLRVSLPLLPCASVGETGMSGALAGATSYMIFRSYVPTFFLFRRVRDTVEGIASSISLSAPSVSMKQLENLQMDFH